MKFNLVENTIDEVKSSLTTVDEPAKCIGAVKSGDPQTNQYPMPQTRRQKEYAIKFPVIDEWKYPATCLPTGREVPRTPTSWGLQACSLFHSCGSCGFEDNPLMCAFSHKCPECMGNHSFAKVHDL